MTEIFLVTVIASSLIAVVTAWVLYLVAKQFHVEEDPRITHTFHALPGVNCGACGYIGCRNFAEACVRSESLDKLYCPVGGNDTMAAIAKILDKVAVQKEPSVAVVRCGGSFEARSRNSAYDGPTSCSVAHQLYRGETGCQYGCLWQGDCVGSCKYGAMHMDEKTGLPVINEEKCISCGACVKMCPRQIIEIRPKGPKGRRVFVSCINEDKGNVAMKHCKTACIGCGRCVKECPFEAITMVNFISYIDPLKCKLCRKCVAVCPTKAIHETNFPPKAVDAGAGSPKA